MRGRKRIPTALKLLRGTSRDDRDHNEPQLEIAKPEPPDFLDAEALAEWHRQCDELHSLGTLAKTDRPTLAAFCQVWSRWQAAERSLTQLGVVIRTTSGEAAISPYFSVAQRCLKELRGFASELGLSPASRSRLNVTPVRRTSAVAKRDRTAPSHLKRKTS